MSRNRARLARRYACVRRALPDGESTRHTAGLGASPRKCCAFCGGRVVESEGLWGTFRWQPGAAYPACNARATYASYRLADRRARADDLVAQWIPAEDLEA